MRNIASFSLNFHTSIPVSLRFGLFRENWILLLERTTGGYSLPFRWTSKCQRLSVSLIWMLLLKCHRASPVHSEVAGTQLGSVLGYSSTIAQKQATVSSGIEANVPFFPSPCPLTLISPVPLYLSSYTAHLASGRRLGDDFFFFLKTKIFCFC